MSTWREGALESSVELEDGGVLLLDNPSGAPAELDVSIESASCAGYSLEITSACLDDLEPSATLNPAPATLPLTAMASVDDQEMYTLDLSAGFYGDLVVDPGFTAFFYSPLGRILHNPIAAESDRTLLVEIVAPDPLCTSYTLEAVAPVCEDDASEPNDVRLGAWSLQADDLRTQRVVSQASPDWWAFTLPANETRNVRISFDGEQGDVDLAIYDDTGTFVAASNSVGSAEVVSVTNDTGSARTFYVEVGLFAGALGDCVTYSILTTSCPMDPFDATQGWFAPADVLAAELAPTLWASNQPEVFSVQVPAFETVQVDAHGPGAGTGLGPSVELWGGLAFVEFDTPDADTVRTRITSRQAAPLEALLQLDATSSPGCQAYEILVDP